MLVMPKVAEYATAAEMRGAYVRAKNRLSPIEKRPSAQEPVKPSPPIAAPRAIEDDDYAALLMIWTQRPPITGREICEITARHFGFRYVELISHRRQSPLVKARQAAMYACICGRGLSYPFTARLIGGRDHTTVLYGIKKAQERARTDPEYAAALSDVMRACGFS